LQYHFYEEVYLKVDDPNYPSQSHERLGYWVGVAEHVGDALTYKVLTADTRKIIYTSEIRPATDPNKKNMRADAGKGEDKTPKPLFIKDRRDRWLSDKLPTSPLPTLNPDELIGRSFIAPPDHNGERPRVTIHRKIIDGDVEDPSFSNVKFILQADDDKVDEIVGYNEVMEHMGCQLADEFEEEANGVQYWRFRRIVGHQGPLKPSDPRYKGSKWNVMVEWETGEVTIEPLNLISKDDPVTVAVYAKEHNLLDTEGWKQFKSRARREKKMLRELKQAHLRQVRRSVRYKYGYQVPRTYREAIQLDQKNGNTKWQDAVALELLQIDDYNTFKDIGHKDNTKIPGGYKKLRVHLVFDVKHDGRHKARLVADGHLTGEPIESVYSGVISLKSLRLLTFLAELNQLELWGADIGNAYLEAETKEKLYIVGGEEFGDRKDHILLIHKALYGLKTSGKRWFEKLSRCMKEQGFIQSKADASIWMRKKQRWHGMGICWHIC
jgi:hypothetical protein